MHSLLKPEVPRLSSLSSHICKNKGEAGGGTADLENRLAFLSGVNASPKQEQFPCCPWLPGVSQGCLQSAGERDTGAEENHGLIFPNILLLQEWWQLEIVLCYHDYCCKDMDRFVWGRGNFSSEIFYSPVSLLLAHILTRALTQSRCPFGYLPRSVEAESLGLGSLGTCTWKSLCKWLWCVPHSFTFVLSVWIPWL